MKIGIRALVSLLIVVISSPVVLADIVLRSEDITWVGEGDLVYFNLRFRNESGEPSLPDTVEVRAQPFGVFLAPGTVIGTFDVPPIPAEGIYDLSFELPYADLPELPEPEMPDGTGCPDYITPLHWNGNIEAIWINGDGVARAHDMFVVACIGNVATYYYAEVICTGPVSWWVSGGCPGWTVTLVDANHQPAPNPLPSGVWYGFVGIAANGTVSVGDQCHVPLSFVCDGEVADLRATGVACLCEPVSTLARTWGWLKATYR
jgi:hypothetical protein